MSITQPDDRVTSYNPVVATATFAADFPVFDNSDLTVIHNGVERTDFTVQASYVASISNDARVMFATGITGSVLVVGARKPRRSNRFGAGPINANMLNAAFDTAQGEMQEARRDIDRSLKVNFDESPPNIPELQQSISDSLAASAAAVGAANGQFTFNVLSEAAAANIPPVIEGVFLRGKLTIADGLGGLFTDANNGNPDTFVSADSRTWYRVVSSNPKLFEFGAKGDGLTLDDVAVAAAVADGRDIDGNGQIYLVTALPADFSKFKRSAFKLGTIIYPTKDFLNQTTAKITNVKAYAGWTQDKGYVAGENQIKAGLNYGDAHLDGDIRPAEIISEDGGVSYGEVTLLDPTLYGATHWSGGVASGFEYRIIRLTDGPPYSYQLFKRTVPSGATGNYQAPYTKTAITFPMPVWSSDNQPVMIHSFCQAHDGSVVVGGSLTEGAILYRSVDGITWTILTELFQSTDAEEPTVKYDPVSDIYCGFMRSGNDSARRPRFWISRDRFATPVSVFTSPMGYFSATGFVDACIPLQIVNGVVHAFSAQRNGTIASEASDAEAPIYYIRADLSNGDNIWNHAETYRVGTAYHAEFGGASGVGQGTVIHFKNKILFLYGSEERTGQVTPLNRINNIWQIVIPLREDAGFMDRRSLMPDNRSAPSSFMRDINGRMYAREGDFVVRADHKLSEAFKNVPAVSDNLIIDGLASSAGVVVATDGPYGHWISVLNASQAYSYSGWRVDNTSGTVHLIVKGAVVARWDASATSWRPEADLAGSVGGPTRRWSAGYYKDVILSPGIGTTVTPASNGDLMFEATSNTSVKLKLKGSDGVVRSVTLTLA